MNGRRCYASKELALSGAIEQMNNIEQVGVVQSVADVNLRHELRCAAAVRANQAHWELMRKLGSQMSRTPLTKKELSDLVYPAGSKHE